MDSNPRHLILNLLLAADGEPMSARDAVQSCALFGIRENSVRVALVRLSASGMIEAEGRGTYRLGPKAAEFAAEIARWRSNEERVRDWNGDWIAVHLGGLGRSDRSALRARERALALLGLRELDPGLYLRPDNLDGGVASLRDRLYHLDLDAEAAVFLARGFDAGRERRARALWDGKALTRRYREKRRKLEDWLGRMERLELDVAARESYLLGNDAIRQLVFDPLLPAPLVDVDERRAFADTVRRYDLAGRAIWQRLRAGPYRPESTGTRAARAH